MYKIITKIPFYKALYAFGFPSLLPLNYTISLTYTCNSRCATCKVYKRKSEEELTLIEYKKIFNKLGSSPHWVTFSGGEPFLKNDLVAIVNACYTICHPAIMNIPSNGILTQKIVESVKEICQYCKKTQIVVNLSIDGIENHHNDIRGVRDNYEKVINTYKELKALKLKNLTVGIHTVVSKFNVRQFHAIANTMMNLHPDQYITEIAENRNELNNTDLDITPDILQYKAVADFMIHRIKNTRIENRLSRITQAFRVEYYNLVKQIMRDNRQVIPCYAGVASCQIAPDGDVWLCCMKAESVGNLRDNKYDIRKILANNIVKKKRQEIKQEKCYCPMANAAYTNMLMDFKLLAKVFYRSFCQPLLNKNVGDGHDRPVSNRPPHTPSVPPNIADTHNRPETSPTSDRVRRRPAPSANRIRKHKPTTPKPQG